jgi:hypothetical protein
MSSNVGLSTPRGSGTSGYVQRNMSFLRPRDNVPNRDPSEAKPYHQRAPDQSILEHDRKREVEVRCLELQDKLEDEGVEVEEIETQVEALRRKLVAELEAGAGGKRNVRGLKSHQVHELAAAKLGEFFWSRTWGREDGADRCSGNGTVEECAWDLEGLSRGGSLEAAGAGTRAPTGNAGEGAGYAAAAEEEFTEKIALCFSGVKLNYPANSILLSSLLVSHFSRRFCNL